jgi:hypothetical protein
MSTPDTGGFDLLLTVAEPALSRAVTAAIGPLTIPPVPVNTLLVSGTATIVAAVTGAILPGGTDISLTIDLTGSTFRATTALIGGTLRQVPATVPPVPINAAVTATGRFTQAGTGGTTVFADFTTSGPYPMISVVLDTNAVLSSYLVEWLLAGIVIGSNGDPDAFNSASTTITNMVSDTITKAVTSFISGVRRVVVTLPAGLPIIGLTLLETTRFAITFAFTMGGPGGSTTSIARLNVLTNAATGAPLDAVVFTISNGGLLRDVLRPILIGLLGLSPAGFLAGNPFAWFGSVALPIGPIPGIAGVSLTLLWFGIDGAGRLHAVANILGTGSGGTFTVTGTIDQAFTLAAAASPTGFTLTATPAGSPAITSDVQIPAWVYAASVFTGGSLLVSVLATVDLFGGPVIAGLATGPIASALAAVTFPVPLPASLLPLAPRLSTSFEADASPQTLTIGTALTIPFPFSSHDIIVNLV